MDLVFRILVVFTVIAVAKPEPLFFRPGTWFNLLVPAPNPAPAPPPIATTTASITTPIASTSPATTAVSTTCIIVDGCTVQDGAGTPDPVGSCNMGGGVVGPGDCEMATTRCFWPTDQTTCNGIIPCACVPAAANVL